MTTVVPIHPGEHLAETLSELGISQLPSGEGDSSTPDPHQRYRPLPQVHYGGHGARNRAALGDDAGVLAEPPADVRPGTSPRFN